MADLITPVAALVLGAALAHANSCTVASARRLVVDRRGDWLFGLAVAVSWAGLTLIAFAALLPQIVAFPAQAPVTLRVVAGGILLGFGATINQGCVLGSIARFGRGDLAYGFTLAGMALTIGTAPLIMQAPGGAGPIGAVVHRPATNLLVSALIFAPIALLGAHRWWLRRRGTMLALIVVGIAGGTVYACNPDWSYASGLLRLFHVRAGLQSVWSESGTLAVVVGVAASSAQSDTFALRGPTLAGAAGRLAGGALMGAGAVLVPGGNDTLMLWAIPGLTMYGPLAYGVMVVTIMVLVAAHQAWPRRQAG